MPCQRFADQADRPRINGICGPAVAFPTHCVLEPASLAKPPHKLPASIIYSLNRMTLYLRLIQIASGPLLQLQRQCFVAAFQKRPIEMVRAKNFSLP